MGDQNLSISEKRVTEILDLRFAQFEKAVAEHFVSEKRAREIVRDEYGIVARQQWDTRSKMAALGVFLLSVSTFLFTMVHGWISGSS